MFIHVCFLCKYAVLDDSKERIYCPTCLEGRVPMMCRTVKGFFGKKKCNDECTHAKSAICRCQCGGANHGIKWRKDKHGSDNDGC